MAQPHKGERGILKLTLEREVRREIHSRATECKLSVSQFLADHLAVHVGRPDMVYALGQGSLLSFREVEFDPRSPSLIVRPLKEVCVSLALLSKEAGYRHVATYVADFCRRLANDDDTSITAFHEYRQEVLATSA